MKVVSSLLLKKGVEEMREALLYAISLDSGILMEVILTEMRERDVLEDVPCRHSDLYPPYMTPLMLASIKNNFAMVAMLLQRGHEITMPHRAQCKSLLQ